MLLNDLFNSSYMPVPLVTTETIFRNGGILGRGRSIRKAVHGQDHRPCAVLAAPLSKWTHPINIQCKPYHSKVPLKILGMCH